MKDLINNLVTMYENAITGGTVSAKKVFKGLQDVPQMAVYKTQMPYIMIDEGGERVEEAGSSTAQMRIYSVVIEIGAYSLKNITEALDNILDLSDEVKAVLELEANRPLLIDGHIWGIVITPFEWGDEKTFFRGRQVIVDFMKLEDRYEDY